MWNFLFQFLCLFQYQEIDLFDNISLWKHFVESLLTGISSLEIEFPIPMLESFPSVKPLYNGNGSIDQNDRVPSLYVTTDQFVKEDRQEPLSVVTHVHRKLVESENERSLGMNEEPEKNVLCASLGIVVQKERKRSMNR